jgi:hypothetical protein
MHVVSTQPSKMQAAVTEYTCNQYSSDQGLFGISQLLLKLDQDQGWSVRTEFVVKPRDK